MAAPEHPFVTDMRNAIGPDAMKRPPSKEVFYDFVGGVVDNLSDEIKRLTDRVKTLEAREDAFKGVHQRALPYHKGSMVTHKGALWAAIKDVPAGAVPGSDPAQWQLAAKGK